MGIHQLPNGKYRLQVRRKKLARIDRIYETQEEAQKALDALDSIKSRPGSLRELWNEYELSEAFAERSENTKLAYRARIQATLSAMGHCSIEELEKDTRPLRLHFSERRKTGLANETRRLEIATLSAVISWAVKQDYLGFNFITRIDRPKPTKRKRRVSRDEQQKFAKEQKGKYAKHARFNMLLASLGCRAGELAALRREHIDLKRQALTFYKTKNNTDRQVVLTHRACALVEEQLAAEAGPFLFNSKDQKTKEAKPYLYKGGIATLKRNNIIDSSYHAHAMRREFISNAIEHGIDILTIKKQTGHTSVAALELYDEALANNSAAKRIFNLLELSQVGQLGLEQLDSDEQKQIGVKVGDIFKKK